MINELLVKIDYFLLLNNSSFPFKYQMKYSVPSKRLLKFCFGNMEGNSIEGKVDSIAHMYCYDSTVDIENLELIDYCYGPITRERVRQILCKFVRKYYRRKNEHY